MKDNINPEHYKIGNFETIDLVQKVVTDFGSFCHGNILKYAIRANTKHETPIEDIKKIKRYCEFWIRHIEGNSASETIATYDKLDDLLSKQEKEFIQDKKIVKVFMNGEEINIPESEAKDIINFLGDIVYGED